MKIVGTKPELCTGCGECMKACARVLSRTEDVGRSAIRVTPAKGGGFDINVCNHCGLCLDLCPTEALHRAPTGHIRYKEELCVGCLNCTGFCPTRSIHFRLDMPLVFKCIGCMSCTRVCKTGAIYVREVQPRDVARKVETRLHVTAPVH